MLTGEAKKLYQKAYMRKWMKAKRLNPKYKTSYRKGKQVNLFCEVCNYSACYDIHHEGNEREPHILCPNCHALITRGIVTLEELLNNPLLDLKLRPIITSGLKSNIIKPINRIWKAIRK